MAKGSSLAPLGVANPPPKDAKAVSQINSDIEKAQLQK